jgi:hypothetical protein
MSVTLQATFQLTAARALSIRARLENAGAADILVLDRLWVLEGGQKAIDPEHVYRFERDGSLRLLLGAAPLPRMKSALYRNVPMGTRVPAKAALDREILVPAPLQEYSVYFPVTDPARVETKTVSTVHLVVEYLVVTPELVTRASAMDAAAVEIDNPVFALAGAVRLVQTGTVGPLEVARRTDEFDRMLLPGEKPEPLRLG